MTDRYTISLDDEAPQQPWVHYLDRPESSERAQAARNRYISANENWQRLQNRGADPLAIARARSAMDQAGDAWQAACTVGGPPSAPPGDEGAGVTVGQQPSRPGPDPAQDQEPDFQAPPGYQMRLCRTKECRAPVMWGRSQAGAKCIMDPEPRENGNIILLGDGIVVYLSAKTKGQYPDWESRPRYVSHFSTCPGAKDWRS